MLDLGDLDEYFDASMLVKVKGKQYRIPPVAADLGLWARKVAARRGELIDASPQELAEARSKLEKELGEPPIPEGQSFEEGLLSVNLVAELVADKVPDEAVKHLAQIVYARIIGGDELALHYARGEDPKAPANRAERRAAKKAPAKKAPAKKASGSRTTSTAAAATTRTPVSGSGTKSPRKSAAPVKAASPGRKF